ncbi:hypothetical protein DCN14_04160 [Burkholderia sp. IDO3]|nr:hypothetical protein DCN14_04160 [Burkholderia sp. IDO3]
MPPARLTDARRSERAPAYGTRTLYLLDTDHGTTRRAKQDWQRATAPPGDGGQTDPPARQARAAKTFLIVDGFGKFRPRPDGRVRGPGKVGPMAISTSNDACGPTVAASPITRYVNHG